MYVMPLPFLLGTLASIASIALLGGGIYILWAWTTGTLVATSWLVSSIAMLVWSAFYKKDAPPALPTQLWRVKLGD